MDGAGRAEGAGRGEASPKLRMRDLTAMTGLDRQTIHFYIQAGLLPEGDKTGRNTALYDRGHVERIELIRRLQREKFLPLRAIRAVLDGDEAAFEPSQRKLLLDVKAQLRSQGFQAPESTAAEELLLVEPLLREHGLDRADFDELRELGLIEVHRRKGALAIRRRDAFRIEILGAIRTAGLTRELGFVGADLLLYEEAMQRLFERERELVLSRVQHLDPGELARIFERVLPLVGDLLHRLHTARVEAFFESLGADAKPAKARRSTRSKRSPDARRRSHAQ
ncbi:MAG: MerR family transcriptional regulator [Polyangiaceae bacterium]